MARNGDTTMNDETTTTRSPWRPGRHFRIASLLADAFTNLIPKDVAETAIATCRITVQGPKAVGTERRGKNWGEWIRTRMQTFGRTIQGYGNEGDPAVQSSGHWKSFDNHQIVADLLDCMGFTMDDFWNEYGHPSEGEKYVVDLPDLLCRLAGIEDETEAAVEAA